MCEFTISLFAHRSVRRRAFFGDDSDCLLGLKKIRPQTAEDFNLKSAVFSGSLPIGHDVQVGWLLL